MCQYQSLHGTGDTDLLHNIMVQHHILIRLSLIVVLSVVSNAVFLSVSLSPIAVGFGSSFQLLSCDFSFSSDLSFRHGREGGRSERKEEEEAGKHA